MSFDLWWSHQSPAPEKTPHHPQSPSFHPHPNHTKTVPSFTVKLYALLFLLVVVLSELEWTKLVRENAITHNWIVRGAFYVL